MSNTFEPTEKQKKAFKAVIAAIKRANKSGLVFYGKSDYLVAYKKNADEYIDEVDFSDGLATGFSEIEHLSARALSDSGADDYSCYRSYEDQEKYS